LRTHQQDKSIMSAAAAVQDWASRLIRREAQRSHLDRDNATRAVARRIGLAPGSLSNVARGRAKRLTLAITDAIRAAMIRELEREIEGLTHELHLARASGADPRSLQVAEVESLLAAARALLIEGSGPT
jgi:transcriptional regulator with XRE-family HTH domain